MARPLRIERYGVRILRIRMCCLPMMIRCAFEFPFRHLVEESPQRGPRGRRTQRGQV